MYIQNFKWCMCLSDALQHIATPLTIHEQTSLSITNNDVIRGDAKLSAIMDSLLEEAELQDMQSEIRSRKTSGVFDPNKEGHIKLDYLRNLYSKKANRNFDETHKFFVLPIIVIRYLYSKNYIKYKLIGIRYPRKEKALLFIHLLRSHFLKGGGNKRNK